ncbi:uncharacterized protein J4E87_003040 [Alternaria ethzedia]|uniref:uncharacterized protein n=1 Tax=Alternaria ethzedia TaxID=181014 RepID=UPI0020C26A1B|nr:uncharacterized protein J4E87_003040 [Alternaria ethzedia]KAI4629853.1 hypothetical protein J4E87_003040 [Alternaria ethzedia]
MSTTPAENDPCCTKCSTPRTYSQFVANHTSTKQPNLFSEQDTCAICQLPYGSENLALQMLDKPLAIINLPGCNHILGSACVHQMSLDTSSGSSRRCPLCRTEWWQQPEYYSDNVSESDRHDISEAIARCWQSDYSTARYHIYGEPEYAAVYPPRGLDELQQKLDFKNRIGDAVTTDVIEKRIQDLRKESVVGLGELSYDPYKVLRGNTMVDPFAFNNYHLRVPDLGFAIFRTLVSSRGFRFLEMYRDATRGKHKDGDVACLVAVEEEWMEMFPKDERQWVRLILNVLWIADLDDSEDAEGPEDPEGPEGPEDEVPKTKRRWRVLLRRRKVR